MIFKITPTTLTPAGLKQRFYINTCPVAVSRWDCADALWKQLIKKLNLRATHFRVVPNNADERYKAQLVVGGEYVTIYFCTLIKKI